MKLLLDHCVPRRLGPMFTGHQVVTAAEMQWDRLRNGALLSAAAREGFDAMVTVDQNLKHQQNLATLPIAVLVIRATTNDIDALALLVPAALEALRSLSPRQFMEVPPDDSHQ